MYEDLFQEFKTLHPSKAAIISKLHKIGILVDDDLQLLSPVNENQQVILEATQTLWSHYTFLTRTYQKALEEQKTSQVRWALATFSEDDLRICKKLFLEEFSEGEEAQIVKVAPLAATLMINRSVAVMTLRKLEAAQLIETRTLGAKGTHVKVINPYLIQILKKGENYDTSKDPTFDN